MNIVLATSLALLLCLMQMLRIHAEVLELDEDEQGMPMWKTGQYRDRNEVPLPPNYDEEKKHRRDVSDNQIDLDESNTATKKKNLINRVHFSMPFGVDLPVYHTSKGKKGKKGEVPQGYGKYAPNNLMLSETTDQYAKLNLQRPDRKSSVAKTWGLTYDNLFPDTPKDTTGQMRSKMQGGYRITEEDLDDGLMFRGLGGMKLRDQNHQIIQSKFAEKDDTDEEMNARSDVTASLSEKRGLIHFSHIFNPFNHHHHHRQHHHHFKPTRSPTVKQEQPVDKANQLEVKHNSEKPKELLTNKDPVLSYTNLAT